LSIYNYLILKMCCWAALQQLNDLQIFVLYLEK